MKRERFGRRLAGATLLALMAATASAGTAHLKLGSDLLSNSGFESGLSGWTTSGFLLQGFDYGVDSQAHSGTGAFYGGAIGDLGFLSQSFATTAGKFYDVSLWLSSDGFLPNEFRVTANGAVLLDRSDVLIQGYNQLHLTFLATGSSANLQLGFRNDSGFLHVDDVVATLVPEPATVSMLGLGLAVIIGWGNRQRAV